MTEGYANCVVEHSFGYSMVSMWQTLMVLWRDLLSILPRSEIFFSILFLIFWSLETRNWRLMVGF